MSVILTVRELTDALVTHVEGRFPFIWVKGEVSNISRPSSGHVYFSLKDSEALLNCVWFKGRQRSQETFDPLTGEVFTEGPRPSLAHTMVQGQQILCAGKVTVYAQRSVCQMVVELVQEEGRGALNAAFEALKERLQARGFFAVERKRPLPYNPHRVAVITAINGAAIHDFISIAAERGTQSCIRVFPVPVQGDAAAPAIVRALHEVQAQGWAEVIVLIRGGGSLEDLWAFNEETVAEAVFHSTLPVVAGIGHEVDVCMTDMTADVRAVTPSHAAQVLWPARQELMQYIYGLEIALQDATRHLLQHGEKTLHMQEQALHWLSPLRLLYRQEEKLSLYTERLQRIRQRWYKEKEDSVRILHESMQQRIDVFLQSYGQKVHSQGQALQWLSPLQLLQRKKEDICRYTERLVQRGHAWHKQGQARLVALEYRLHVSMTQCIDKHDRRLEVHALRLDALSPLAPLARGYALVHTDTGHVLTSVQQAQKGQCVYVSLADGVVSATVDEVQSS